MQLFRLLLAILLPPVAVFLTYGFSFTLLISIALTLLGWVPGIIHALWAISKADAKLNQSTGSV
ncbi:YqaE/Pmp3 family membrane protein [Cyanobacteria bacterium FACHB-63]|nr:YqaE/Pmp3 family membrane protein [Cyanobacteria bacterium FACHB-63]